jgi:dihydrofolate reductase
VTASTVGVRDQEKDGDMSTITAFESITLDGVMQAPGRPDEDSRGGFTHGGWGAGFDDEAMMRFAGASMSTTTALLFGHRSYDDMLSFWSSTPEPNPFTEILVNQQKYVVSRDDAAELAYPNSTLLAGEAATTVAKLREPGDEAAITVLGSGELVRSLHAAGLIDEYVLQIHPIVLGSGTRLFGESDRADLTLTESVTTSTGVILARYRVQ